MCPIVHCTALTRDALPVQGAAQCEEHGERQDEPRENVEDKEGVENPGAREGWTEGGKRNTDVHPCREGLAQGGMGPKKVGVAKGWNERARN